MATDGGIWTAARDFRLRQLRLEGAGWEEIGAALWVGTEAAVARAGRISAREGSGVRLDNEPEREALPPGHPRAWSVLTEGTWLAGSRYPQVTGGKGDRA